MTPSVQLKHVLRRCLYDFYNNRKTLCGSFLLIQMSGNKPLVEIVFGVSAALALEGR